MNFKISEKSTSYGNAVKDKSFEFAVRIVKAYKYLNKSEYSIDPLLKQLLKSGTSIGQMFTKPRQQLQKKIL